MISGYCVTPMHHLMIMGSSANPGPAEAQSLVAVVATLSKGYDLDTAWPASRWPARSG
jgi:hypothetical protein